MSKDKNSRGCWHCRFFLEEDNGTGICRRHPPVAVLPRGNGDEPAVWPTIYGAKYEHKTCGDWKAERRKTE